ncbi:MAG: HNH endonuclease [Spirulinaceae cyanobacterium RM2_2_10]|nr:HNH endonuclease [Spirulinaceae cyanobacterium SM2_1_0]NJO20162.1 HNH endonuclease [Spirulinaceae cyanobacterium RM2_2_10]
MSSISPSLRQQVYAEANGRCEYCCTPARLTGMPLVVDHIMPRIADGSSERENLAAACYRCNEFKGARTAAIDPDTGEPVTLFQPRRQTWTEHFCWQNGGTHIAGQSSIGRATVLALRLNNPEVVAARTIWIHWGWHPP